MSQTSACPGTTPHYSIEQVDFFREPEILDSVITKIADPWHRHFVL
jgi:hypothetical protein